MRRCKWSGGGSADEGVDVHRRDGGPVTCSRSVGWVHWLRHLAVEVVIEEVAVTLLSGCKWSRGGGSADGGGDSFRRDSGQLACSRSVVWLHRLRYAQVDLAAAETVV